MVGLIHSIPQTHWRSKNQRRKQGMGSHAEKPILCFAGAETAASASERCVPESGIRKGGRLENFMVWKYNESRRGAMALSVILLNGASSSGKSTLARALRQRLRDTKREEYRIVSIDDFLDMTAHEPIYEDDVYEISHLLCQKALDILKSGDGAIIDHVITSERIYRQLTEALKDYPLITVQVTCPLRELEKREKERGDRSIGSAKASCAYLYPQKGYDLTLNTLELSPEECSEKICALLD